MSTTKHINVLLTIPEEKELALMDADGDDRIISAEKTRAAAKSSAELSVSTSRLWKIVFGVHYYITVKTEASRSTPRSLTTMPCSELWNDLVHYYITVKTDEMG